MILMLKLFYEFFKIGLFAVGGGAATIPFLSSLSETTGWFTKTDLANMIAISESTPGAIGVNMSTHVGFLTGHPQGLSVLGCVVATLGLVTPSVIIIIIISGFLKKFSENKTVKNVLYGLRPASVGLIAAAAFEVVKVALIHWNLYVASENIIDLFDIKGIILFAALFIAIKKIKLHPVAFVAFSALIGILFKF